MCTVRYILQCIHTCTLFYSNSKVMCVLYMKLYLSIAENGKRDHKHSPTTSPMATPTSGVSYVPSRSKADAARHHIASELLHTEKNFVNILNIIVRVQFIRMNLCLLALSK